MSCTQCSLGLVVAMWVSVDRVFPSLQRVLLNNTVPGCFQFGFDAETVVAIWKTLKGARDYKWKWEITWGFERFNSVQLRSRVWLFATRWTAACWVSLLPNSRILPKLHSFSSKEQASFNFMASVTICSDFGAQENKVRLFLLFPHLRAMKNWDRMPWSYCFECWVFKPTFSLSSFTFVKRL